MLNKLHIFLEFQLQIDLHALKIFHIIIFEPDLVYKISEVERGIFSQLLHHIQFYEHPAVNTISAPFHNHGRLLRLSA